METSSNELLVSSHLNW